MVIALVIMCVAHKSYGKITVDPHKVQVMPCVETNCNSNIKE